MINKVNPFKFNPIFDVQLKSYLWGMPSGIEATWLNPDGPGSSPRLGCHRPSFISIEHAELLTFEQLSPFIASLDHA